MSSHVVSPRQVIPLVLTVSKAGSGGVTGLTPTVQLYRSSDGFYLDWNDSVFKSSGWTTIDGSLSDIGGGNYTRSLDLAAVGAVVLDVLVAFYKLDNGPIKGVSNDVFNVEDLEVMRQLVTNRIEDAPGNPGTLTLYDDDGVTPRAQWNVRDATGGAVVATVGTPSRRSAKL